MTEALDHAEETTPTGFRRYKRKYDTIRRPWWIFEWIVGEDQDAIPPSASESLAKLDELASGLIATETRQMRSRKSFPHVRSPQTQQLDTQFEYLFRMTFGLDQKSPVMQLRMAVARAWLMSWCYADLWLTRKEHVQRLKQLKDPNRVEAIIASTEDYSLLVQAIDHIEYADHSDWVVCAEAIRLQGDCLRKLAVMLDPDRTLKDLTQQKPENFFFSKLAELYTFSFGREVPFHASDKHTVRGKSPDRQLSEFIETVLQLIGYPDPLASRDRNLREIRNQSVTCLFNALGNIKYRIPKLEPHLYAKAKGEARKLESFDFCASYDQLHSAALVSEYGLTLDEQSLLYASCPA
ncbi:hypothetical protein ACKTEK_00110 [Tepidamorphus sp. 3E244]|uniref:hypothetical protein n=1 Tax=Tepidamorphus sp. 3E244 TaxID=3385498 RepID=UPI0038FCF069